MLRNCSQAYSWTKLTTCCSKGLMFLITVSRLFPVLIWILHVVFANQRTLETCSQTLFSSMLGKQNIIWSCCKHCLRPVLNTIVQLILGRSWARLVRQFQRIIHSVCESDLLVYKHLTNWSQPIFLFQTLEQLIPTNLLVSNMWATDRSQSACLHTF